jgi:hypothetical protein
LLDFETGAFAGFSVEGNAFGPSPAPAPLGMYGRFAADSGRNDPAAHGVLRSQPFVLEAAHLRFVLAGPADPGL